MRCRRAPLVLAAALLAAGCADRGSGPTGPGAATRPPADELLVEVDPGDGAAAARYTLTCGDAPGGDHPDPAAACAHLAGLEDPFAPLPDDLACTEVYGGPQTARVTGTWGGVPVDLDLSRTDGCRIAQWDALGPLLPGPVGAGDPLPD
ncbi:SSI family serine proteinase inhibitor [Geodermatophilus sp. SYSU D00766]